MHGIFISTNRKLSMMFYLHRLYMYILKKNEQFIMHGIFISTNRKLSTMFYPHRLHIKKKMGTTNVYKNILYYEGKLAT